MTLNELTDRLIEIREQEIIKPCEELKYLVYDRSEGGLTSEILDYIHIDEERNIILW